MNKNTVKKNIIPYAFLLVIMIGIIYVVNYMDQKINILSYDEFMEYAEKKEIEEILQKPFSIMSHRQTAEDIFNRYSSSRLVKMKIDRCSFD